MQARFYAPWFGRFLSPDPARDQHFEETQSWNIYSYVQNNPVMSIDPSGMFDLPDWANQFIGGFTYRLLNNVTMNLPEASHGALGIGPAPPQPTTASTLGALVADGVGFVGGNAETGGGIVGGVLTSPTGAGAVIGGGVALHGLTTTTTSAINTVRDVATLMSGGNSQGAPSEGSRSGANEPKRAPESLEAFPDAKPSKAKTPVQGGGGKRERWKDSKGRIYEWDSRHGTVEKYDKRGRHQGEFDPSSGKKLKDPDKKRKVEP